MSNSSDPQRDNDIHELGNSRSAGIKAGDVSDASSFHHEPADARDRSTLIPTSRRNRRNKSSDAGSGRGDSIFGTLVVCMFLVVMVMGYFLHSRIAALEAAPSSATDAILIIDYQSLFANLPEDITGESAERMFNDVHQRIMALQDAGYIVLDANAVLAAPAELRIDGSLLLNGEL